MKDYLVAKTAKGGRWKQKLISTIKTHKEPGEVSLRLVHSAVHHPTSAIQYVIGLQLRKDLKNIPHLVASSDACLEQLRRLILPAGDSNIVMYKIDIKDFYMVGGHQDMVSSLKRVCTAEPRLKEAIADAVCNILFYCFTKSLATT